MKTLLVAEYRDGKVLGSSNELVGFAEALGSDNAMVIIGDAGTLPAYSGKMYLADASFCGEFNPDVHKQVILEAVKKEQPDMIAFSHSSYGWDMAPRVAFALQAAQISEVVDVAQGELVVPLCNAKLRRNVASQTPITVVTVQAGAFAVPDTAADAVPKR